MSSCALGDSRLWRPVGLFVCAAVGLCIGRWLHVPVTPTALLAVTLAGLACARFPRAARRALLALAAVAFAAAWWGVRIEHAPTRALYDATNDLAERPIVCVEGVIAESPRVRAHAVGVFADHARPGVFTIVRLDGVRFVDRDEPSRASGSVWASVSGKVESLRAGERVRVWGRLAPAGRQRNPGDPDYRLRALERGLIGFLSVPGEGSIERLAEPAGWRGLRARVRDRASRWLQPARDADDPASALLLAALTGERVESLHEADAAVQRVGAAHLLAISGLHLTSLVGMGVLGVRLVRDPGRSEPLIGAALALVYLLLTPARAPIVRAAMLTVALMAGEAIGTRWRREALLAWAATLTILWRPTELFSPGFQLSYACVGGLVMFTAPVRTRLFRERRLAGEKARELWLWRWFKSAAAAAIVAWLIATPILAHHLGVVNPLGVLAVLVLTPVFMVVLGLGFIVSAVSLVSPAAAAATSPVALTTAEWFLASVTALESLPATIVYVPRAPLGFTVGALAVAVWWLWKPRVVRAGVVAWGALALSVGLWLWRAERTNGLASDVVVRIDMLDVGDGSFFLVRTRDDAFLWDAGGSDLAFGRRDARTALREVGAWRVPEVFITHANLDHFGALPDVAPALGVRRVRTTEAFLGEAAAPATAAGLLLRRLDIEATQHRAGDELLSGAARVLWPPAGYASERANDHSLVLCVEAHTAGGVRRLLLTGDIEPEAARALLAAHPGLRVDVLELPHHGSARLARTGFVERLSPSVVLQSSGRSRLGDERWDAARAGREWLMTAEVGAAWVEITRAGAVRSGSVRG